MAEPSVYICVHVSLANPSDNMTCGREFFHTDMEL